MLPNMNFINTQLKNANPNKFKGKYPIPQKPWSVSLPVLLNQGTDLTPWVLLYKCVEFMILCGAHIEMSTKVKFIQKLIAHK